MDDNKPLFVIPVPAVRFKFCAACITGRGPATPAGRAFVIEPPAINVRLAELVIVPELTMFCIDINDKFNG